MGVLFGLSYYHWVEIITQTLTIIGAIWSLAKHATHKAELVFNNIITVNANRISKDIQDHFDSRRSEFYTYIDGKFTEHEKIAFARLNDQDCRLNTIENELKNIIESLRATNKS